MDDQENIHIDERRVVALEKDVSKRKSDDYDKGLEPEKARVLGSDTSSEGVNGNGAEDAMQPRLG